MMNGIFRFGSGLLLALAAMTAVQASSPAEKIICAAPETRPQWMTEARIREIFGAQNFTLVKQKISRGGCYEFYAVHQDGSIVEAYYHPITGEAVRYNRVNGKSSDIDYETLNKKPEAPQAR